MPRKGQTIVQLFEMDAAIMSNDLAMGHVNQSVYNRVDREIAQAEAACTAGRDAEAVRMVNATKARHGYL